MHDPLCMLIPDARQADLRDQLVPLTQQMEQQGQQGHALRSEGYALQMWLQQRLQQQQGALDAIGQQLGELRKGQLRVDSRAASAAHQATKAAAVVAAVQEQQAAVLQHTTGVMVRGGHLCFAYAMVVWFSIRAYNGVSWFPHIGVGV